MQFSKSLKSPLSQKKKEMGNEGKEKSKQSKIKHTTTAVVTLRREKKKNQASTGFEPVTTVIPVQCFCQASWELVTW